MSVAHTHASHYIRPAVVTYTQVLQSSSYIIILLVLLLSYCLSTGKNILVFDEGQTVKLADFGSAMKREEISMTGSLVGCTPHYSAPEVCYDSSMIV